MSYLNITPPATPEKDCVTPPNPGPPRPTGRPPTGKRCCSYSQVSPYVGSAFTEWLRIGVRRAFTPQRHIHLRYSTLVSFYHPRLNSLARARAAQPTHKHRVWTNTSAEDARSVANEVDEALIRDHAGDHGSGVDWADLAEDIVDNWSDRVI